MGDVVGIVFWGLEWVWVVVVDFGIVKVYGFYEDLLVDLEIDVIYNLLFNYFYVLLII